MLDKLEFVIWALKMIQSWPKYHRKTLLKKWTSLYLKNGPFINFITQIFTSRPDSKSKLDYEGKLKAVTCPDIIITNFPKNSIIRTSLYPDSGPYKDFGGTRFV